MKLSERGLPRAQVLQTGILCLFSVFSIAYVLMTDGVLFDIFYCLATIPFVSLPLLLSLLYKWRFNNVFYAVFSFYALGPILGAVYKLYYVTSWWDDMLHILAGLVFAVCGAQLTHVLNRGNKSSALLCAFFGVFFSLGIAVLWEIFEFSSDMFLGSDMQADTIIYSIATKVGRTDGGLSVFSQINDVAIDGTSLGFGGYLDIGLMDTMRDMIVETGGALLYLVYVLVDRDRHPLIHSRREGETTRYNR